ncbi:hypothetical protein V8C34DRAFT_299023 [Trichoderma compactum]
MRCYFHLRRPCGRSQDCRGDLSTSNSMIQGLYCVGEILGGLFYGNYPGGSGLTSGSVVGKRAGKATAAATNT